MRILFVVFLFILSASKGHSCDSNPNPQKSSENLAQLVGPLIARLERNVVRLEVRGETDPSCFNEQKQQDCLYTVTEFDDADALIAQHAKNLEPPQIEAVKKMKGRITFVIALTNDNRLYGHWRKFFGIQKNDDNGFTHGGFISLAYTLPDNVRVGLSYRADLYTQQLNYQEEDDYCIQFGTESEICKKQRNQYFTNDNKLLINLDHIPQQGFGWKASIGLHQLDSENSESLFHGSRLQAITHDMVGFTVPSNVPNGKGNRWGLAAEVGAIYRTSTKRYFDNNLIVRGTGEVDAFISTHINARSLTASISTETVLQDSSGMFGLGIFSKTQATFHHAGIEASQHLGGGLLLGPVSLVYSNQSYFGGEFDNYQDYNLDSRFDEKEKEDLGSIRLVVDFAHWSWREGS